MTHYDLKRYDLNDTDYIYGWLKTNTKEHWSNYGGLVKFCDTEDWDPYFIFCVFRNGLFHYIEG